MNGFFVNTVHLVVIAGLISVFFAVMMAVIEARLGVVISVLLMASMFWTACSQTGSTEGVWASWLAIGITCGCFCLKAK